MNRVVAVTPGYTYSDIDGLGCAVAYTEFLRHTGKDAVALLPGRFNNTITPSVRSWSPEYTLEAPADAQLVLVDVSDPNFIAKWRDPANVVEVFDHHAGADKYWNEKLGDKAHIEFIGAAATLVWEQIKVGGYGGQITQTSARLLYTAILSNTLNFNAGLTHQRDHDAFSELAPLAQLRRDWPATYFHETENEIFANVPTSLRDDTKILEFPNIKLTLAISQLELWDGADFVHRHQADIKQALESHGHPWFHTTPSISEHKNYLFTEDPDVKKLLERAISANFKGPIGQTTRLWMRKEIQKRLLEI